MKELCHLQNRFERYFYHSLLITIVITIIQIHLCPGYAHSAQMTLSWDPPVNADGTLFKSFSGYKLLVGNASRTYTQSIDVGNTTTHALNNLSEGLTYYFAVTDYDAAGNESGYSNEVSKTLPLTYSLIATAGAGGTISSVGTAPANTATDGASTITSVTVIQGATQSFSITPNSGFTIATVTGDGVPVGAVSSYTFPNVTANHTLTAAFTTIPGRINVALQANGGVATASSTYSANYTVDATNDGDRKGQNWGAGGGWNDATFNTCPDWVQITFDGQKTIDEIDVFTLQDAYTAPIDPTSNLAFTKYGVTAFDVQYWTGIDWVTVSGGAVTGNNLVWRKLTFPAVTTDRIRVLINASQAGFSRIVEIEAYAAPPRINVALRTNGGIATASSTYSTNYTVGATNDGDRKGLNWGAGGGWNDATTTVYPDWVQITFNGPKPIDEIDVFTLQDTYTAPIDPTSDLTFTKYGVTAFDVQYWNGTAWVTAPGGSITGNNLVWRKITLPAITTDRIRVQVNASLSNWSRIIEIEAFAQ